MGTSIPPLETEDSAPELGKQVRSGLKWALLNQAISRVAIFLTGIAFAHLLSKAEYGVYGVALTAIVLLLTMNEIGVMATVIRWQGDVREIGPTGRTIGAVTSVFWYAVTFIGAPYFAGAMGAPEATSLVRVLAIVILIDGFVAVPLSTLTRDFRQDRQFFAEVAGLATYVPISIVLAVNNFGPWSIVWARLSSGLVTGGLLYVFATYRPKFGWNPQHAREILGYGIPAGLSGLVEKGILQIDNIVVAALTNTATLGAYVLAFNLSSLPVNLISVAVNRVAFAGFSRVRHDKERLRRSYMTAMSTLMSGVFPMVTGIVIFAPQIIEVIYSNKWEQAVTPLRALAILGALRILIDVMTDVISADGYPRKVLYIRLAWIVALLPALILGTKWYGLTGTGVAHALVAGCIVTPVAAWALHKHGIHTLDTIKAIARPILACIPMAATGIGVVTLFEGPLVQLMFGGIASVIVYCTILVPANPIIKQSLETVLTNRRARNAIS